MDWISLYLHHVFRYSANREDYKKQLLKHWAFQKVLRFVIGREISQIMLFPSR